MKHFYNAISLIIIAVTVFALLLLRRETMNPIRPGQIWAEKSTDPDPFRKPLVQWSTNYILAVVEGYVQYRYQNFRPDGYSLVGDRWCTNSCTKAQLRRAYYNVTPR